MGLESGKVYHRYRGGAWREEGRKDEGGKQEPLFHASRRPFRLIVLFFTCMLTFGSYFCFGAVLYQPPSVRFLERVVAPINPLARCMHCVIDFALFSLPYLLLLPLPTHSRH